MRGKLVVGASAAAGLLGIIWWQSGVDTFLAILALGLVSAVIGYVTYRRRNSTASWSAAWAANGIEPSPWMQWDELVALDDAILPDSDGAPAMGDPHPLLARALIRALAREHNATGPHRLAAWAGYEEEDHSPSVSFTPEAREMVLYSGPLLSSDGAPLAPVSGSGRVPMYWWPDDLSWCVGQDIYARSLLIGCSLPAGLAILAEPDLDAYRVREDDQVRVDDF